MGAKLKVGDRVRALNTVEGEFTSGKTYVVRRVNTYSVTVERDDSGRTDNGWGFSNFELVTPALRIEAGKFYKTRDGRKVGPIKRWTDDEHPWMGDLDRPYRGSKTMFLFKADGRNFEYTDLDLVALWEEPTAPVAVAASNDNGASAKDAENDLVISISVDAPHVHEALDEIIKKLKKIRKLQREVGIAA